MPALFSLHGQNLKAVCSGAAQRGALKRSNIMRLRALLST
jgi:hypothetical protein